MIVIEIAQSVDPKAKLIRSLIAFELIENLGLDVHLGNGADGASESQKV